MADSASKRRRLSWASPGKPSPGRSLQLVPSAHHEQQQDIIEFFAQRGERKKELEAQVQSLEANVNDLQARLTQTEAALAHQKEDLIAEQSEKAALERILEKEKDLMESALQIEIGRASSLQVEVLAARQQRSEAEAAREQTEARLLEVERAARRKHEELDSRAARLEAQLHQQGLDMDSYRRRSEAEASRLQQLLDIAQKAQRELEEQLEEAVKLAEDSAQRRRHAEAQAVSLQADLEAVSAQRGSKGGSGESDSVFQLRMLQDLVQRQEDEVKEARALKSHASKAAILEEQLQAAEVRCRRLEATAVLYAQLQAAQQPQKRELEQWRSLLGDLPEAERGPQAVMRILDELRGQTLSLADQTGQHKAEALRMQGELQAAQAAARAAAAAQSQLEAAEAEASGVIARLERKVALLTKERDVLKEIVASYDAEEANFSGDAMQTPQKKRLDSLEATNTRLTEQVAHLEEEAAASSVALRERAEQMSAAVERAAASDGEVARLQAELESHEKQIALLEARVGRGEYNPANSRVLHYVHNPEAEARREHEAARISELEAESATLRAQLQALQPREAGVEPESVATSVAAAEKTVLEQKVKDLEKQQSRLKQVFKTQVSNFREACYCLFGYRIDMASQAMPTGSSRGMPPTTFVLKPQHADVPSAQLLFKMESEGQMALLPNDYILKHLSTEAETFITRFKSIPAFTANLTMENFQKQTRC